MLKKRYGYLVLIMLIIGTLLFAGCGGTDDAEAPADDDGEVAESLFDEPIVAKMASEEVEGDPMTHWGNEFADGMREWSDGDLDIEVFPFGTIGENRDINELAQLGVVEFVYSDYAWISSFVPEAQVLGLHYLWPEERVIEVFDHVMRNGDFMGLLTEAFRKEGLVPLGVVFHDWQWISSNDPINKVDDLKGMNIRLMGSEMLSKIYRGYNASPTALAYGEIYSALQTGLLDAQVQPIYAQYSMKFFEVQNYLTQIYAEPFVGIPTANMQFFDGLPQEAQEKMLTWWQDATIPEGEWTETLRADYIKEMEGEIEFVEITGDEKAEFEKLGREAHSAFLELGGDNAQEVYDTLVADIAAAKDALGIEE